MDKMREEFEAWARESINPNSGAFFSIKRNGGFYFNQDTHVAWLSWQASRAARVVELPPRIKSEGGYYAYDSLDIHTMLDAGGIKYE